MVEGSRFPKFERWLEKECPVEYEEEIIDGADWGIGILFIFFGLFPLAVSNFTSNLAQIIGLFVVGFGIIIEVRAYILHRIQKKQRRYHGLSRVTISEAIMFIDSKLTKPQDIESTAPHYVISKYLEYTLDESKQEFYRFLRLTIGLIVWPSTFIDEVKADIKEQQKRLRQYSILFVILLLTSMLIEYYIIISGSEGLLLVFFLPLLLLSIFITYAYLRYYFNNLYLFKDKWLSRILESGSIGLEETMIEILKKLKSEFPYPLIFYLTREYPLLYYTGRTDEGWGAPFVQLNQAVLYPEPSS